VLLDIVCYMFFFSLPVNDDRIRGRLISIAATFLLTTATEWTVKETEKKGEKSVLGTTKLNRSNHYLSGSSTSTGPDNSAPQSAKIQEHTKEA